MGHPGRLQPFATGIRSECSDCGADLEEARRGGASFLRCPWAPLSADPGAGDVSCGWPYSGIRRIDPAAAYARDMSGRES